MNIAKVNCCADLNKISSISVQRSVVMRSGQKQMYSNNNNNNISNN
jgi:hypothetical protein